MKIINKNIFIFTLLISQIIILIFLLSASGKIKKQHNEIIWDELFLASSLLSDKAINLLENPNMDEIKKTINISPIIEIEDKFQIYILNKDAEVIYNNMPFNKGNNILNSAFILPTKTQGINKTIAENNKYIYSKSLWKDGNIIGYISVQRIYKGKFPSNYANILYILYFANIIIIFFTLYYFKLYIKLITEKIKSKLLNIKKGKKNIHQNKYVDLVGVNLVIEELENEFQNNTKERNFDESKFTKILDGMYEGLLVVNLDERLILINKNARKLFSIDNDDIILKPIWEIVRIPEIILNFQEAINKKTNLQKIIQTNNKGTNIILELNYSLFLSERDIMAGVILIIRDITEVKHLENIRNEFVSNASHELKTPITVIKGFVETMLENPNMDESKKNIFLEKIKNQNERLASLVQDLLRLARLESINQKITHEKIELISLIDKCSKNFIELAKDKGISFKINSTMNDVFIDGDKETLHQIFSNLLDNTIKYTNQNGKIDVTISETKENIIIKIRDTGIGISEKDQKRIFERFYRVDKARSKDVEGTGLGLSIVKHGILAHNGDISLESKLNKGSIFTITLPKKIPNKNM